MVAPPDAHAARRLTRNRVTAGNSENPLDRVRVGRVPAEGRAEPTPDGPASESDRSGGQGSGVGRVDGRGEGIEQIVLVA